MNGSTGLKKMKSYKVKEMIGFQGRPLGRKPRRKKPAHRRKMGWHTSTAKASQFTMAAEFDDEG